MRDKNLRRKLRHYRIRKKIFGTKERPRLVVYRSLKHIYVQAVNDEEGKVITGASSLSPEMKNFDPPKDKKEQARYVGYIIAERLQKKGIKKVVFDRAGYKYHGRVKALAEGAREKGLEF